MRKFFNETMGFITVIIASIIADAGFLYILDLLGYFSWIFECYEKTLELFFNIKDVTFLKYWKVMLSDVAVIASGIIIIFMVFDWTPNGIIDVLGYDKFANKNVDNDSNISKHK